MFLEMLTTSDALRLWPDVVAALREYPELWDFTTPEALRGDIEKGDMQMWMLGSKDAAECMFLTQIYTTPRVKVFQVWLGIGNGLVQHWAEVVARFRLTAREEGCARIEVITRRIGLVHLLRAEGFRMTDVTLAEDVPPAVTH